MHFSATISEYIFSDFRNSVIEDSSFVGYYVVMNRKCNGRLINRRTLSNAQQDDHVVRRIPHCC
jgi:hypothetical protein